MQDDGLIRLLARASGGVENAPLSAKCGSRISSPHLADKSRVVGEYGGNIEPISNRPFDITIRSPGQVDVNRKAKKSRLICTQVCPDTTILDVARQAAREFQLSQDHLEACRFCCGCGREEAVTSTKNLHEVGIHSHYEIHTLMRLQGGVASRRKPRERVEFNQEPCHIRRGLHLLCPPTCRCGTSLQRVEGKTEVI